jgi:hypothetical protein
VSAPLPEPNVRPRRNVDRLAAAFLVTEKEGCPRAQMQKRVWSSDAVMATTGAVSIIAARSASDPCTASRCSNAAVQPGM